MSYLEDLEDTRILAYNLSLSDKDLSLTNGEKEFNVDPVDAASQPPPKSLDVKPECSSESTIRVLGLPAAKLVSDSRLLELFQEYGEVTNWNRSHDRHGRTNGATQAIVKYASRDQANAAIEGLKILEIKEGVTLVAHLWTQRRSSEFSRRVDEWKQMDKEKEQRALCEFQAKLQFRKSKLAAAGVEEEEEDDSDSDDDDNEEGEYDPPSNPSTLQDYLASLDNLTRPQDYTRSPFSTPRPRVAFRL